VAWHAALVSVRTSPAPARSSVVRRAAVTARHGDRRAPIFIGGGVTFAAKPRSFEQKVNRKMYRGAMCAILSELNRQGRLTVVEQFEIDTPKTKTMIAALEKLACPSVR